MPKPSAFAIFSGLAGAVMIGLGAWAYSRNRGLSGFGRVGEAQIVGGYNDGNMKTVLRHDNKMPIEMRIAEIQKKVRASIQDGYMRKVALQATAACPERDGMCEARAIYDYVKQRVRYTGDIAPIQWEDGTVEGVDLYQTARRTLEMRGGDCDDQTILVSTLLALNGITPILRVVRQKGDDDWSHILPGALLPKGTGNKFIALDTTLPGMDRFGIELPVTKFKDFPA